MLTPRGRRAIPVAVHSSWPMHFHFGAEFSLQLLGSLTQSRAALRGGTRRAAMRNVICLAFAIVSTAASAQQPLEPLVKYRAHFLVRCILHYTT